MGTAQATVVEVAVTPHVAPSLVQSGAPITIQAGTTTVTVAAEYSAGTILTGTTRVGLVTAPIACWLRVTEFAPQ